MMANIFNNYVQSRAHYGYAVSEPVKGRALTEGDDRRWAIFMAFRLPGGTTFYADWRGPAYEGNPYYGHCRTRQEHKTAIIREMRKNGWFYLGEVPSDMNERIST